MSKLPEHFQISESDGGLYDTRDSGCFNRPPLRACYVWQETGGIIETNAQFKAALRAGRSTDHGGYPVYFIMADGEALSFEAALSNVRPIMEALDNLRRNGYRHDCWLPLGLDVNWESDIHCSHTNKRIPSAYRDFEEEDSVGENLDQFA